MRAIVQSIAATTDSTVHLANRLLTLARIEHGSEAAAMAPVSLLQIVRQVGLALALPAVQKRIDLSLEALDEVTIDGQAQILHELVINLVDNAIRYTPAGGAVVLRVLRVPNGGALLEVKTAAKASPKPSAKKCSGRFTARRRRSTPTRTAPGWGWRSCATLPRCTGQPSCCRRVAKGVA
ncbi:MAG: sensor histidine kinase [Massilia sp.]|nr:sensor histidine kinase [Massilia sp.]